ncbi:hypothetical protein ACPFL9_02415 [Paenarthrobacter sp. NyZ202]|uniref:hypothetical protein n=1 Tax=Paenarthrobacter sp. NyZ202 TaxID=3402689 RepID=UPI003CEDBE3C
MHDASPPSATADGKAASPQTIAPTAAFTRDDGGTTATDGMHDAARSGLHSRGSDTRPVYLPVGADKLQTATGNRMVTGPDEAPNLPSGPPFHGHV